MPHADHARRYGHHHRLTRQRLVAAHTPGDPCAICYQPMRDPVTTLDLAHAPGGGGYLGLAHRRCNRGAGQATTNRQRAGKYADPAPRPRTQW